MEKLRAGQRRCQLDEFWNVHTTVDVQNSLLCGWKGVKQLYDWFTTSLSWSRNFASTGILLKSDRYFLFVNQLVTSIFVGKNLPFPKSSNLSITMVNFQKKHFPETEPWFESWGCLKVTDILPPAFWGTKAKGHSGHSGHSDFLTAKIADFLKLRTIMNWLIPNSWKPDQTRITANQKIYATGIASCIGKDLLNPIMFKES